MRFSIHVWLSAIRQGSWSDPLLYASYGAAALPPHSPHTFRYSTQPECPRHGGKRSGRSPGVHLGAAAWWETIGTVRRCDIPGTWPEAVGIIGRAESAVALIFVNQWITTDTRFPSKCKGHLGRGPSRLSIRHYFFIIDAEFMFRFSELLAAQVSPPFIQLSIHHRQTSTTRGSRGGGSKTNGSCHRLDS